MDATFHFFSLHDRSLGAYHEHSGFSFKVEIKGVGVYTMRDTCTSLYYGNSICAKREISIGLSLPACLLLPFNTDLVLRKGQLTSFGNKENKFSISHFLPIH